MNQGSSNSDRCFQSDKNWGNHDVVKKQQITACKELRRIYRSRQVAARCRNNSTAQGSYIFEIENCTDRNADISQDECERNIRAQIDNCDHDDEVTHSGVRFRYVLNKRLWSTRLLLLIQIEAIRIVRSARDSNILEKMIIDANEAYELLVNCGERIGRD